MRNLKKVLALVLALVMAMSLATIANAASFSDADDIQYTEAVDVLTALGVIDGVGNNTFRPEGNVTRAQMAKMITIVALGDVEPDAFLGTKTDLTDINGHWAEAYIKYCYSQGIISGRGNGIFDPDDNVTTAEASKMLLTAIGYNSKVQGYTGAQWTINVARDAQTSGFYADLTVPANQDLTRDQAAQLIYNAVQADLIVATPNWNASTGTVTYTYEPDPSKDLLSETFGAKIFVGTFEGNYNTGDASAKGEIEIYGRLDTEDSGDRSAFFPSDLAISNIGEEFKVLFKDGKGGTDNRPDKNDTIYGIYNTNALTVYNITKADLQDADTNVSDGKIMFGDNLYKMAANVSFNVNYGASTAYKVGADTAATYVNTPANGMRVTSSDAIKLVCNSDGDIAKVYVQNTKIAEVTAVTATNIQMTGEASKKIEKCANTDGVAVGDIARYADMYPTATRTTVFYDDAQKVEGVIEAYNASGSTSVRIDGTWYKYNGHNSFNATASSYTAGALVVGNVGDTVSLILDGGNNYGAYKVITGFNNYAMVTAKDTIVGSNMIKAMLADGTTGTYTNVESADGGINYSGVTVPGLYAYELRSEGTKIALNRPTGYVSSSTGNYVSDDMTLRDSGSTYIVSADAVVYLSNGTKWQAYTATELNSFAFTGSLQYILKDGKVVAMSGTVTSFPTANTKNSAFGYVTGVISTKVNDSPVTELTVWNGTDNVTLLVDGTSKAAKGSFIRYPIVADGAVISDGDIDLAGDISSYVYVASKVKSYDVTNGLLVTTTDYVDASGNVVTGTDSSYKLTADTVIIGVNSADKESSTVNVPVIYTQVYGKDYNNVMVVYENKGSYNEVKAIFVDEDNHIQ